MNLRGYNSTPNKPDHNTSQNSNFAILIMKVWVSPNKKGNPNLEFHQYSCGIIFFSVYKFTIRNTDFAWKIACLLENNLLKTYVCGGKMFIFFVCESLSFGRSLFAKIVSYNTGFING